MVVMDLSRPVSVTGKRTVVASISDNEFKPIQVEATMNGKQRPVSPFMIGPYYKPQMTSLMSITHRATGVFLSIAGVPLLLWWIMATAAGPESYASFNAFAGSLPGKLLVLATVICVCYHLLNGIRHLVWDTGHALEIRTAYRAGWAVLIGTVILAAGLMGALI